MVSTVTTSTVSTVTTIAAVGVGTVATAIGSGTLLSFLATKELVSPVRAAKLKRVSQVVMIGVIPLSIAFAATIILKVAGIVS